MNLSFDALGPLTEDSRAAMTEVGVVSLSLLAGFSDVRGLHRRLSSAPL